MASRALMRVSTSAQAPSLWDRLRGRFSSVRSYWLGPFTPSNWPGPEAAVWGSSAAPASGVVVSEETALSYAAVFSAVALISADIASLPLMLFKRLPGGGKDRFDDHDLYRLLHDVPNPEMSSMSFRETLQAHVLTWGNGYAEIERNKSNRPIALWPITPDRVTPMRDNKRLIYRVVNPGRPDEYFDPPDLLHVPGLGFDGIVGYSVVAKARESLGLGVAAERFGGTFFGNGSTMGGVITYPNDPSEPVKKSNREALDKRHQGVDRAHKMLALYGGAKYERIGIPPNDAQFLETRVFQVREVARWFKLPPHKLGDLADATFSNVEQQNLDYYTSCLRPWLEKWEQELERKLISPLERRQQFIEHVTEGFLRADAAGRAALEKAHFEIGATTPNEIRASENRDPIKGGDRAFVPMNMIPLDRIDEIVDAQIKAKIAPPEPPPAKPSADTEEVKQALLDLECRMEERAAALKAEAAERAAVEAERDRVRADLATVTADHALATAAVEQLTTAIAATRTERDTLRADLEASAAAERMRLQTELQAALLAKADVDARLTVVQGQHDVAETVAREAHVREAVIAERLDVLTREHEELAAIVKAEDDLKQRLIGPQRDVLVHAVQCVLQREADRARKAAGTPDKLRKWTETFYQGHAEFCRQALRPSVRAWLALAGDLRTLPDALDGLITAYIEESREQLALVLDEGDAEHLGAALEQVLRRWESERAAAVVDRFIGGTHGG